MCGHSEERICRSRAPTPARHRGKPHKESCKACRTGRTGVSWAESTSHINRERSAADGAYRAVSGHISGLARRGFYCKGSLPSASFLGAVGRLAFAAKFPYLLRQRLRRFVDALQASSQLLTNCIKSRRDYIATPRMPLASGVFLLGGN